MVNQRRTLNTTRFVSCSHARTKISNLARRSHFSLVFQVEVDFTFEHGRFQVDFDRQSIQWEASKSSDFFSANREYLQRTIPPQALETFEKFGVPVGLGFSCSLVLCDGHGVDHEGKVWTDEMETLTHQHLGIPTDYSMNDSLQKIFLGNNMSIASQHLPRVISCNELYRSYWCHEFARRDHALSYAFWYCIFNNDRQSKPNLIAALQSESNRYFHDQFLVRYNRDLDLLYSKLRFFDSSAQHAFWFCVFHDLWYLNQDVDVIVQNRAMFDVNQPTSLAWNFVDRSTLETRLDEMNLLQPSLCGLRNNWFTNELIDNIFSRMLALKLEADQFQSHQQHRILMRNPSKLDDRIDAQPDLPVDLIRQASLTVPLTSVAQHAERQLESARALINSVPFQFPA